MKIKILLLFITLNYINSYSQIDSTKVSFVSYWSVGDSYDFKISKLKQRWKKGKQTKNEKQNYIANFTVIDSTETSYTINWSYENDLENTFKIPEELLGELSKYKLTEVMYKTSEVGAFIEVLNWKEIAETTSSMFDDVIKLLGDKNKKQQKALKKTMQPLKQIYSSKQGVEQLILKELQYFHFPMGLEFDITEPLIYQEELPNMFGGNPIKAKAKLYFEDVDFEESFCTLKQEMKLDPNDTKEILKQVFKKMKLDNKGIKKALKTAVFEIEDNNTFEYYYYPGVPHKIETIRETIIDMNNEKGRSIDKITIELIYNE